MTNTYIVPYGSYNIHMEWENEVVDMYAFDIYAMTISLSVFDSENVLVIIDKNLILYNNVISHQQSKDLVRIMIDRYDTFEFSWYIEKFLIDIGVSGKNNLNSCIESYERSRKITEFYKNDE